jgi:hypothetical protein
LQRNLVSLSTELNYHGRPRQQFNVSREEANRADKDMLRRNGDALRPHLNSHQE